MSAPSHADVESIERNKREAVGVARRVATGALGIIAGCRLLARLGEEIVDDRRIDPDFVVFVAVDSETDHLPIEYRRSLWEPGAFLAKQVEVARFEEASREEVLAACRSVIARFGDV